MFARLEIGVEDRIDEDDEDRLIDVRTGQRDRARGAVLRELLDEDRPDVQRLARVALDFLLQMAGDVDDLFDIPQLAEIVEEVRHDRLAGDTQHRLGRHVRVRPQSCTLPRERDDDLHRAPLATRRTGSGRIGAFAAVPVGESDHIVEIGG